MTASQIVLLALVLVAFALGWVARGRRAAARVRADAARGAAELDAAWGAMITSYQAVLGLWQAGAEAQSPLVQRALAAFEIRRREFAARLSAEGRLPAAARDAAESASAELERVAEALGELRRGQPLGPTGERSLLARERRVAAARSAFMLALATEARREPSAPAMIEAG
jgi:hypothetical protein